jgi:hypothetical protein
VVRRDADRAGARIGVWMLMPDDRQRDQEQRDE